MITKRSRVVWQLSSLILLVHVKNPPGISSFLKMILICRLQSDFVLWDPLVCAGLSNVTFFSFAIKTPKMLSKTTRLGTNISKFGYSTWCKNICLQKKIYCLRHKRSKTSPISYSGRHVDSKSVAEKKDLLPAIFSMNVTPRILLNSFSDHLRLFQFSQEPSQIRINTQPISLKTFSSFKLTNGKK